MSPLKAPQPVEESSAALATEQSHQDSALPSSGPASEDSAAAGALAASDHASRTTHEDPLSDKASEPVFPAPLGAGDNSQAASEAEQLKAEAPERLNGGKDSESASAVESSSDTVGGATEADKPDVGAQPASSGASAVNGPAEEGSVSEGEQAPAALQEKTTEQLQQSPGPNKH